MNQRYFKLALLFIVLFGMLIFWPVASSDGESINKSNLHLVERDTASSPSRVIRKSTSIQDEVGVPEIEDDSTEVVISVLAEESLIPVGAAEIFFEDGNHEIFLGSTGPTGKIQVESLNEGQIVVRHSEFAPKKQWIDDFQNLSEIVILLGNGASIVGKINAVGKSEGFEDFHVVGWDVMMRPTKRDWEKWYTGEPSRILEGKVSEEGDFVLTGLDGSREYQLLCGGPGFLSRKSSERIVPSSLAIALPVAPLFGCRILVNGQPPSDMPSVFPRFWQQHSIDQDGDLGDSVHPREQKLLLAGISTPLFMQSSEVNIFYQPLEGDNLLPGPVHSRYFLPGFEIVNASTVLDSTETEIVEYAIYLPSISSDFGSLTIRFAGQRGPSSLALQGVAPTANLRLQPENGGPIEYQILNLKEPFTASGIPVGQYSYQISFGKGLRPQVLGSTVFKGKLLIGREAAVINASVHGIGGLEARYTLPNGRAYTGPAMVTLSSLDENGGNQPRVFRRAPYRFIGLPSGRYRVKAYQFSPNGGIEQEFVSGEVLVYGQEMTLVDIQLPQNSVELF